MAEQKQIACEEMADAVGTLPSSNITASNHQHNFIEPNTVRNVLPANKYLESVKDLLNGRNGAEYNMRNEKRGNAHIFNQENFCTENPRKGTEKDSEELGKILQKLYFNVNVYNDYTVDEIMDVVQRETKKDYSCDDCILIAIFSHGTENGIISAKDKIFELNKILNKFTDVNCPTLKGKPKLFFLQVCQGGSYDSGVVKNEKERKIDNYNATFESYDLVNHPDFLIVHPNVPGYVSFRLPGYGSWFIQELCKELKENAEKLDILTLLTYVSQSIAKKESTNTKFKQIPCITSMLSRIIRFDDKKSYEPEKIKNYTTKSVVIKRSS